MFSHKSFLVASSFSFLVKGSIVATPRGSLPSEACRWRQWAPSQLPAATWTPCSDSLPVSFLGQQGLFIIFVCTKNLSVCYMLHPTKLFFFFSMFDLKFKSFFRSKPIKKTHIFFSSPPLEHCKYERIWCQTFVYALIKDIHSAFQYSRLQLRHF